MADEAVQIVITAKDEAGRVLEQAQTRFTDLAHAAGRTGRTFDDLDLSASKAARGVRSLIGPIVSELSPALGETTRQFAGVIATAAALGTGFGAVAIGAASLAGIVGGNLLAAWQKNRSEMENWHRALQSSDPGFFAERMKVLTTSLLDAGRAFEEAQRRLSGATPPPAGGSPGTPRPPGALPPGSAIGRLAALDVEQLRAEWLRLNEEFKKARAEFDLRVAGEQELAGLASSERLTRQFQQERAAAARASEQAQRGLFDFQLDPIEARFRQQIRQADDLARTDPATAVSLRTAAAAERTLSFGVRFAANAPVNPFETAAGQEAERKAQEAGVVREDAAAQSRIQEFLRGAPINPFETEAGQEAERRARDAQVLRNEQERIAAVGAQAQLTAELLELEKRRLDLAGQLTPELSAQLTQLQAAAIASDERLTPEQKALALAQAQVAVWQDLAALDPLQGLITGFSRVANESRQLGTELERFARETGSNMERAFSDTFFDAFTGKKGEDIGKRFGESMLRSFTDILGRQLSGSVSGLFASALRGFVPGTAAVGGGGGGFDLLGLLTGSGGGGGAIISPTGAPAGTLVVTQAGLVQVTPSGALQLVQGGGGGLSIDQGVGLLTQANTLSGQLGGPTLGLAGAGTGYLSALAATPISSILQYGLTTAVAQTQAGVALGFGASAGGTTFAVAGPTAGAPLTSTGLSATSTGASAGATVGGVATGVLAAVALGFTIYGGLTQEQTAQNIAMNAISGAISGAILGAVIGSIFPGIGTVIGGVIGAIAGGAAAGGTTGLKAPKKMSTSEKSLRIAEAASNSLVNAIRAASSIEDLVTIFNTQWAPGVNILTTYQGVTYWAGDYDDPAGPAATVELMIIPEFLDALEIQVGEAGAPRRRQDLIDEFRSKRDEILGILSNIPFGILEQDRAAGVSRRTYLPFQQIYSLKPGTQALIGSSEFYRRDLGGEDDTIDFLMDRIRERSIRRDVDLSRDDFLFR